MPLAGQQGGAHEIAQRIHHGHDLGRQAAGFGCHGAAVPLTPWACLRVPGGRGGAGPFPSHRRRLLTLVNATPRIRKVWREARLARPRGRANPSSGLGHGFRDGAPHIQRAGLAAEITRARPAFGQQLLDGGGDGAGRLMLAQMVQHHRA